MDPRRKRLLQAAQTHVLVIHGERMAWDERLATVRRLDMDRLEAISSYGTGDPSSRKLIGTETDGVVKTTWRRPVLASTVLGPAAVGCDEAPPPSSEPQEAVSPKPGGI